MTTAPTGSDPTTRPRRRRRAVLVTAAALLLALVLLPVVAYAAVTTFAAHDHGTLDIVVDGTWVDLDQPRFHDLDPQFHVHPGHGNLWHHHPRTLVALFDFEPMSLREALGAMGAELTETSLRFDGSAYDLTDPAVTVTVRVDHADVDLDAYVVGDGDRITVEVTTGR